MEAKIQFIKGLDEKVLPDVRLTRSRDSSTGTATFRFKNPNILDKSTAKEGEITGMYLIDEEGTLETRDVNARFVNGKPEAIESIYIMKSPEAWDRFMRFMERYGRSKWFSFYESKLKKIIDNNSKMQIPLKWINELVNVESIHLDDLIEKLTLGGFEVEEIIELEIDGQIQLALDISATANRSDSLSIQGIATEIAALLNQPITIFNLFTSNCDLETAIIMIVLRLFQTRKI